MIRPGFASGVKIAERVPTTSRAAPVRAARQAASRWLSGSAECSREPDLGNEHQDLAARVDHVLHPLQVDLGLAAAGHALDQECSKSVAAPQGGKRLLLVIVQCGAWLGIRRDRFIEVRRPHLDALDQALAEQTARGATPLRQQLRQLLGLDAVAAGIGDGFQQLGLPGGPSREGLDVGRCSKFRGDDGLDDRMQGLALAQQGRQGGGDHLADRVVVIVAREPQ
jgi:hypothetical protein